MENIKKIESWIEAIESSNLSKNEQEKRINALVDLWKFSTSYDADLSFTDVPGIFAKKENGISTQVNVHCEPLYIGKENDIATSFFSEIEQFFRGEEKKYAGIYKIELNKALPNFNAQTLKAFKEEIIAAIKGEVILYQYIAKLNKFPADKVVVSNQNFTIFECNETSVLNNIAKLETRITATANKWLVLMLNNLEDQCNYYAIENSFSQALETGFEKVFLFDFYKAEVIAVDLMKDEFKVSLNSGLS